MLELAEKVKEVVNPKPNRLQGKHARRSVEKKPDISKAMKVLGWEPKIKLEDGLLHMIGDQDSLGSIKQHTKRDHIYYFKREKEGEF